MFPLRLQLIELENEEDRERIEQRFDSKSRVPGNSIVILASVLEEILLAGVKLRL